MKGGLHRHFITDALQRAMRLWFVHFSLLLSAMLAASPFVSRASAQTPGARLRVYLDCQDCFQTYLRDEIEWVDFVRQREDAEVHLLSSSRTTASGGREVVLRFIGVNRFEGADRELRAVSDVAEPENLRRNRILQTVTVGLLGYLAQEGLPQGLDVEVDTPPDQPAVSGVQVNDPWNFWVFRIRGGSSIEAEESSREVQWSASFSGDRVTEDWKISFGVSLDERRETFDLDEDDPFEVKRHERSGDWFIARGLGPHWSAGVDGRIEASTFDNIEFQAQAAPTVEYSIFPYSEYATRQFVIQYQIGIERSEYNEITLFEKTKETLWQHEVSAEFDQRQPWGSVQTGVEFSQYLHDTGLYRLEADGQLSVRLLRGLSVSMNGSASRNRDQISLPRRSATSEEVLLRLRELQSGYDVQFSISVSYSFGSLFNNVVNPRFGDDN